jgi:predicted dehydrogenase
MYNIELVAVCDAVLPRAAAFAQKFAVPRVYGSLDEMLAAENLHAVHVLLPPDIHFTAAKKILASGVNVFIEKPMCDRGEDCEARSIAKEGKLKVGIGR